MDWLHAVNSYNQLSFCKNSANSDGSYNTISLQNKQLLDFRADKLDNLYLFTTEAKAYGEDHDHLFVNTIINGENHMLLECDVKINQVEYLGFNNVEFSWLCGDIKSSEIAAYHDLSILTYNIAENCVTKSPISQQFQALLEGNFDIKHIGKTSYFVNILESSIQVTSYNILDDSITTLTCQTEEIKKIVGRNIKVVDNNGDIYLQIKGRNTANGAKAKFLMHLNTGDNSSNFAKDNRTVSTFIRIN